MAKNLVMTFLTETGKKSSLRVPNVKDNVTKDEVLSVMNTIIAKNIFAASEGSFVKVDSARIEDSSSSEISLN